MEPISFSNLSIIGTQFSSFFTPSTPESSSNDGALGYVGNAKRRHDELRSAASSNIARAEAIGYAQDLGSIEVGKLADLIVLVENPLEDIRNTNTIKYVMKNGELFDGDTLE
jgi:cytosine/adenosine deaminase-related metal-dependent hydrolase